MSEGFTSLVEEQMKTAEIPEIAIKNFLQHYEKLCSGETGEIPEFTISPVSTLPALSQLDTRYKKLGEAALDRVVMLKLNGGLGTSMGLQGPKSLLPIRGKLSFLDVIVKQALSLGSPLLLMNSFATQEASREALKQHPTLLQAADTWDLPLDFLQHQVPKIDAATLAPVKWPKAPAFSWCPPGHGDLYIALQSRGVLDALLDAGIDIAFVSNSDNLGAVLLPEILGYMLEQAPPFLMEVVERGLSDRKGGHVAVERESGGLLLREIAQCPASDLEAFQDITRHRFFNSNNLWIDLRALRKLLDDNQGLVSLPLIRNQKTVDPRDPSSPKVFQLETAMGSALSVFPGAQAMIVPRSRLIPVKRNVDLLKVRSDRFMLDEYACLVPDPTCETEETVISLDPTHVRLVDDLETMFPHGPPSLRRCSSLSVEGTYSFGRDVVCVGDVVLRHEAASRVVIPDGTVLTGEKHSF